MASLVSFKKIGRFRTSEEGGSNESPWRHWGVFLTAILGLKFLLYFADPYPMLFLGDSLSYIHTGLTGWIPPDRSFVYGFLVKIIAVSSGSLQALVVFQVILSAAVAVLVSYCLVTYINTSTWVAHLMGVLCAVDPLQLLYERFVMTETVSLFLLSLYILLSFRYIRSRNILDIVWVQIIGILVVSIRVSFLPLILVNAVVLPVLLSSWFSRKPGQGALSRPRRSGKRDSFRLFSSKVIVHLLLSVAVTLALHQAYKSLNGCLMHHPPAYQYSTGLFLLADWCPVVKPVDFPDPVIADRILESVQFELNEPGNRSIHRWMAGGLISVIEKEFSDPMAAERFCRKTAMNALKRDPFSIARLGWNSFREYWDVGTLKRCLHIDCGNNRAPEEALLKQYEEEFGLSREDVLLQTTITKRYFIRAWPYYLFLLCSPVPAFLILPFLSRNRIRYAMILFLALSEIICISSFIVERPIPRFLHASGFVWLLVLGIIVSTALRTEHGEGAAS